MMQLKNRKPDFQNIAKVLRKEKPDRPTLFEFYMNDQVYRLASGITLGSGDPVKAIEDMAQAFAACGYDYVTCWPPFSFPTGGTEHKQTISLNAHACIKNREDFEAYAWPDPDAYDYSYMEKAKLPEGMKLMPCGPCGLLENVVSIVGYDNLCFMLYDDPELVEMICERVGAVLLRYYVL